MELFQENRFMIRAVFFGATRVGPSASRGSALAPSAPGWLGYNRGDPLIVSDISELIFSSRARLNCELSLQFEPVALFLHRQFHIHHLAHLSLLAVGGQQNRPGG